VVGDRPGAADAASEEYVTLLLRELKATTTSSSNGMIDLARIRAAGGLTSIFFGGGTPSLTPPRLVKGVIDGLERAFGLSVEGCEVRAV
jgi:oxygen-independent coproporphyrinogen-3 oxidase